MKKYIYLLILATSIISCESDTSNSEAQVIATDGQGGSLARFTLKGSYLYTVDNFDLNVFNVADNADPIKVNTVPIGFDIETLFGYKDYLYIGSQNGMFIYSLNNPEFPERLSSVEHFTACDPVIANDTHAFVTLHSETFCGNDINVLEIYDISKITDPILLNSRNLTFPRGLGLYGDYLFVCDDEIKVFDVTNAAESKLVTAIKRSAFDLIIRNDLLIAIGESGLYQYRLTTDSDSKLKATELSMIPI